MIRRSLFFFLVWVALSASLWGQSAVPRLAEIDVQHYQFALTLSDETDAIQGAAEIRIRFLRDLPEFYLDLAGPRSGKGMTVTSLTEDGLAAIFRQADDRLYIQTNDPLTAGEVRTYQIRYAGVPADGLIISRNRAGERTFFGDNWPNRAHHWLPTVDHLSDKASVEFIVTAPDHYQVVSNGIRVEETVLDSETRLTHWREDKTIPTKVMVIGAAPFAVQHLGEVAGVPLSSWVFRYDRANGFYDYAQAAYILDYFISHVGPYPFGKLANVQSKTRYGGMENASSIFYAEQSVTGARGNEDLLAHEIAHQWFGNSASESRWQHLWLSEGFATYFTDLYWEHTHGRDAFVQRMEEEREQVIAYARRSRKPVVDTTVTDYNRLLNPNSYQKGGWVLHMLRHRLGDDDFWEGVRTYYDRYQYGNAATDDFRLVMEEVSGQELSGFFRQWLYRGGHPELDIRWRYDAGARQVEITLTQQQQEGPFTFSVDLAVQDSDGKPVAREAVTVSGAQAVFRMPVEREPVELLPDPDTWLLFEAKVRKE